MHDDLIRLFKTLLKGHFIHELNNHAYYQDVLLIILCIPMEVGAQWLTGRVPS